MEFFLLTFTYSSLPHLKMDLTFPSPGSIHHLISVFMHVVFKSSLYHGLFSHFSFLFSPLQAGVCSQWHRHCQGPLCLPGSKSKGNVVQSSFNWHPLILTATQSLLNSLPFLQVPPLLPKAILCPSFVFEALFSPPAL